MKRYSILVVDDDQLIRWSLQRELKRNGFTVLTCESGEEALDMMHTKEFDILLLDIKLPGISGLNVLDKIKREAITMPITLMITGYPEIETAVEAMKCGATDYIAKPFNIDDVLCRIERATKTAALEQEVEQYRRMQKLLAGADEIAHKSPAMAKLVEQAQRAAMGNLSSVLLLGGTGTGKSLLASLMHKWSDRGKGPFMVVSCSSLPETLLESEIFGHEKGAFTSAGMRKRGLFEAADGGTIFLDEIGDIPFSLQSKLLTFLESHKFRRIGSIKEISVDVRVIAATNKNLQEEVADGRFREDLYFRINATTITIPPLRERTEDIAELTRLFIEENNKKADHVTKGVSPEAMNLLENYMWPGNVRELKNVIERAVLLEKARVIEPKHLPAEIGQSEWRKTRERKFLEGVFPNEGMSLEEAEKFLIRTALEKCDGNQSQAARMLKISRDTLRYRMKKYGISSDDVISSCDSDTSP